MVAFLAHSKAVLAVKSFLLIIVSLIKSPRPKLGEKLYNEKKKHTHNDKLGMKKRRKQRREGGGKEGGKKRKKR